jgi:DNA polymerase-3 subunit alpha
MDNIPSFINRKHGKEEPDYLYPSLEPILKETFGIMIYQEQVMQIAQVLAGYSLGGADLLRRAMGKKIKEEMEAQRKTFIDGSVGKGVKAEKAGEIFDLVNKFAGYGFNKSHAAAYALVAYQTAWLKTNHPVEFFAASMTYDMGNTDKLNVFRQELQRLGIKLLPPDINKSEPTFAPEQLPDGTFAVRYAMAAIKNVGAGVVEGMFKTRQSGGAYKSLEDFCERIDPKGLNKRQLENLVLAGTFDSLNKNRHQVYDAVEQMLRQSNAAHDARGSDQNNLFGDAASVRITLPSVLDWPPMERLQQEFGAIGFYLSAHPLDSYGMGLKRLQVVSYAELLQQRGVSRAKMAGIVVGRQERTSQKGNRYAFVQMTDASGIYEATVFSERLVEYRELLEPGRALLLTVDVRTEEENLRLMVAEAQGLDNAVAATAAGLKIFVRDQTPVSGIKQILDRAGKGKGRVQISLDLADLGWETDLTIKGGFAISGAVRSAIKAVPGVMDIQDA